jgi:hypothetical protein
MLAPLLIAFPLFFGQVVPAPAWSVAFDPTTAHASNVHWTLSLTAHYCGGFQVGDGVYLQPEAPLALPDSVPADGVLFAGQAADVSLDNGVLRVAPSPEIAHSMICMQGDRPLTVELLPSLGLTNPDPGTYAVDVWTGAQTTPVSLPVTVDDQ